MERKLVKNNALSHKKFLITLIQIFNSIQQELQKIPNFDCKSIHQLEGIDETSVQISVAEREIKKEHEVKLFKETYEEISQIGKKKPRGRKSDIVMKFTMVSDILIDRIREQLCIKGESKQLIMENISGLKDSFMSWGRKAAASSQKKIKKNQECTKVTQDYKLKYIFSEIATTNASGNNSRSISKHQVKTQAPPLQVQEEAAPHQDENSFKLNRRSIGKQRLTVNYSQSERNRSAIKRYTNTFITTDCEKKVQTEIAPPEEETEVKEKEQVFLRKPRKKTNFFDKQNRHPQPVKNVQWSNGDDLNSNSPEQTELISEQRQMKKSTYYLSQNYIRSRKNIQNITLFVNVNKSKKRISDYLSSESSASSNAIQDMIFLEPTDTYKSHKLLTKKYILDDSANPMIAKSEKSLPRRSVLMKGTSHPCSNEKKPISKFHRQTQGQLEEIRLERSQFLKKKFTQIKENGAEIAADSRGTHFTNVDTKNIGQFYNQLGELRNEFKKEFDPYYQNRSIFFHQQTLLWEEQKRHMQRLLEERNKQFYFRQFEMASNSTFRDEEQALRAIRTDLFTFTEKVTTNLFKNYKLDQIDLNKVSD